MCDVWTNPFPRRFSISLIGPQQQRQNSFSGRSWCVSFNIIHHIKHPATRYANENPVLPRRSPEPQIENFSMWIWSPASDTGHGSILNFTVKGSSVNFTRTGWAYLARCFRRFWPTNWQPGCILSLHVLARIIQLAQSVSNVETCKLQAVAILMNIDSAVVEMFQ